MDFRDDLQRKQVLPMVMGALLLVLLPLFRFVPLWVAAFSVLALLLAWLVRQTLPAYVRLILVVAATVAVVLQHRALFTREAGLSLIVLMISFKLLETKKYRDAMLILAMVFFLIFTGFLLDQSLATSLYLSLCTPIALAALLHINQLQTATTVLGVWRHAARFLLIAIPMMIAFYVFFPRLAIPLWILPGSGSGGTTGFSEEMNFGDVSSLALNDELAFRVEFDGELPAQSQRYWRTIMLTEFDGFTWRLADQSFKKESFQGSGEAFRYTITLQPHRGRWLPVLDTPVETPQQYNQAAGRFLWLGYELRRVISYSAVSQLTQQFGQELSSPDLLPYLQLPQAGNARAKALGRELQQRFSGPEQIAEYLSQQINQQDFYYTLSPPELAEDLIDDFWFNQRRGFCEHYAASVAFILRAAQVPTRVIGGYQGGDYNPFGRYLTVLQADAHAWVEYWSPQRGWIRFDPTASISPLRVEPDLRQRLRQRDGVLEPEQWLGNDVAAQTQSAMQTLYDSWQMANQWFEAAVVQFNRDAQQQWLRSWGMSDVSKTALIQALVATVFIGLAMAAWFILRAGRASEPLLRCYQQFEQRMSKRGIVREPSEAPLHYFSRCEQGDPQHAVTIASFSRHYLAMRFGASSADITTLKTLIRQLH